MEQLRKAATAYWVMFEHVGVCYHLQNWNYRIALLAGLGFLASVVFCFIALWEKDAVWWKLFLLALGMEAAGLYFLFRFEKTRNAFVLERLNRRFEVEFATLDGHRKRQLTRHFGQKPSDFIEFAAQIDQMREQYEKHYPRSNPILDLLRYVYHPESKARIYTLLLAIASAVLALAIRQGAGLDNLFQFFEGMGLAQGLMLNIAFATMIGYFLYMLGMVGADLLGVVEHLGSRFAFRRKVGSDFALKYVQKDLVRLANVIHLPYEAIG
ncbi:hypothetical protein [Pseudoduganella sp. HUAS MS19]